MREVEIVIALDHPALSLPLAFGQVADKDYWVVYKVMPNSLDQLFEEEQCCDAGTECDETRKSIVAFGIVAGMAYLHRNGVMHRDLKPANVLLDSELRPAISDFGFSKYVPPGEKPQMSRDNGTPLYNAPELVLGDDPSFPIDVYAWAFIYYEIVVEKLPFFDQGKLTSYQIGELITRGIRPTKTREIEDAQWEILQACWDSNPSARLTFEDLLTRQDAIRLPECDDRDFDDYLTELGI
jgi:serine/threonine protein kinase